MPAGRVVVVGVFPGQPDAVVLEAARFASAFGAELLCAHADSARYAFIGGYDGAIMSMPLDPDLTDAEPPPFPPELAVHLEEVLAPMQVPFTTQELAGDPSLALARVAAQVHAIMIVVGTRRATVRGAIDQFLNGSVAAHLAHRQRRPVVVVPLNPSPPEERLPWES